MSSRTVPIINVKIVPLGTNKAWDVSDQVLSLKYEDSDSRADKLTLTINNEDLRNFDEPIWRYGSVMIASWGYPDTMTVERLVHVMRVSGFRTLTVEGAGGELALDRIQSARVFENATYSEVARQIATAWGYRDAASVHIQPTTRRHAVVKQGKMTDAQLMRKMAAEEHFLWYIQHDGFHFHDRNLEQQTLRRFRYYVAQDVAEVLDLQVDVDVTRVPGSATVQSYDPIRRAGIKLDAEKATDEQKTVLAERRETAGRTDMVVPGLKNVVQHVIHRRNETLPAELQRNAQEALYAAQKQTVKLGLTVIGDPNLYAKTVIELEGIGQRLSQRYYVHTVTHNLGGGYTCELECESDGTNGPSKSRFFPEASVIQLTPKNDGKRVAANASPRTDSGIKLKLRDNQPIAEVIESIVDPSTLVSEPNNPPVDTSPPVPADQLESVEPTSSASPVIAPTMDLRNRPYVRDSNGQWATIRSIGVEGKDGLQYVIPTVSDDGRIMSAEEAIATFESTGAHAGAYRTIAEADAAAEAIHKDQEANPPNNTLGPTPNMSE